MAALPASESVAASLTPDRSAPGSKEIMRRRVFLKNTAAAAFAGGVLPKGVSALLASPHFQPDGFSPRRKVQMTSQASGICSISQEVAASET